MFKTLKKFLGGFVQFNREALGGGVLSMTPEEHKQALDARFESAKRLSDFIGMIVRFAFVVFATRYFLQKVSDAEGFERIVLSFCTVSAFGLMIVFASRIARLLILYEGREVPLVKNPAARWFMVLVGICSAGLVYAGVWELVSDIAATQLAAG